MWTLQLPRCDVHYILVRRRADCGVYNPRVAFPRWSLQSQRWTLCLCVALSKSIESTCFQGGSLRMLKNQGYELMGSMCCSLICDVLDCYLVMKLELSTKYQNWMQPIMMYVPRLSMGPMSLCIAMYNSFEIWCPVSAYHSFVVFFTLLWMNLEIC